MTSSHPNPDPTILITLSSSSPTLSLSASDTDSPFHFITTATQLPPSPSSFPLTLQTSAFPLSATPLATWSSPLNRPDYGDDHSSPALMGGAILPLTQVGKPGKVVAWENYRVNWVPPRNLSEDRAFTFETVPVAGEGELIVRHLVSRGKLRRSGVGVGQVYETRLRGKVGGREIWWTYGDLATDLMDKKFGYGGVKDGKGGIVQEGEEWATSLEGRAGNLRLVCGEEIVRFKIVE